MGKSDDTTPTTPFLGRNDNTLPEGDGPDAPFDKHTSTLTKRDVIQCGELTPVDAFQVPAPPPSQLAGLHRHPKELRALNSLLDSRLYAATPASIAAAYTPNDFEILGACFRKEVEVFLHELNGIHSFKPDPFFYRTEDLFGSASDDFVEVVTGDSSVLNDTTDEGPIPAPVFNRDPAPHLSVHGPPITINTSRPSAITRLLPSASIAPRAAAHSSSSRLAAMFSRTDPVSTTRQPEGGPPDDDGSDNGDDNDPRRRPGRQPRQPGLPPRQPASQSAAGTPTPSSVKIGEAHFDHKLKIEIVPTWNGDTTTLARWILRVNAISKKSPTVATQLGTIVPQRLTSDAETWYYSLRDHERATCEIGWQEIRDAIGNHFMNRAWVEKTRRQAMAIRFRDTTHPRETPSQYFIRKQELLELVYEYSDAEIIAEVMAGAPHSWKTLLTPRLYETTREFQDAIREHEDDLLEAEPPRNKFSRWTPRFASADHTMTEATANAIGFSPSLPKPSFPKDDTNVSKRTPPDEKGARSDIASQTTGRTTYQTHTGPLKMNVEAYVVKGMTAPFILGNDFADHSRIVPVQNSLVPGMEDENGHAFSVSYADTSNTKTGLRQRRLQLIKKRHAHKLKDPYVRVQDRIVIPPKSSRLVSVSAKFPTQDGSLYVEKIFNSPRNGDDVYAAPDTLITKLNSSLHISNFSDSTLTLEKGQATVDVSEEVIGDQRTRLLEVLGRNVKAFSLDGRLGMTDTTCTIPLRPGSKEVSLPPFPGSPAKREVMDKQMDTWLRLEVIEPSKSPWGAPGFIVYRNGKPRMVIDYRKLNEMTIPDEFPLPKQEDIMNALSGAQWLSTMDALSGFTQVLIQEEDRPKTAFRTHRGLHQFRRMPFGLRNGPSIFQRIMQNVLAPYLWVYALVYIDDIVIYSKTFDEHVGHVDRVLTAVADAGITLSPAKCHFAYRSLMLLGQKVSRLGLSTHKDKVDAIIQLAEPKNLHELQTFLGMMVYFSAYVPFYAWIAAPLFQLQRKDSGWHWTAIHQEAFDLCKQVLTQAPIRAHPMQGLPYRVYTDACDYGLAGILQQVQPIQIKDLQGTLTEISKNNSDVPKPGKWSNSFEDTTVHIERVIAYWSRILKSSERNYSPTEREALALKESLIKFQSLIEGEQIFGITDHAALTWSKTFQNVNRRLLTWGTVFAAYPGLRIIHRAGRIHSNVDPISRLRRRIPMQEGPITTDNVSLTLGDQINDPLKNAFSELGERFEEKLLSVASKYANSVHPYSTSSEPLTVSVELIDSDAQESQVPALSYIASTRTSLIVGLSDKEVERWRSGYLKDNYFSNIIRTLTSADDKSQETYSHYFRSQDGLLYFEDWNGSSRLCVPNSLQTEVMAESHNVITEGAHAGYHRTYNRVASTYYWPRMSRDVRRYVSTCDLCQKAKPRRHAPIGLLRPIPIPSRPFEVVTMDFIPELPTSNGFDNVLVIVDKLTKYGLFIPTTTNITEKETADLFFKHVVTHYGLPRQVITDRDARWRNDFWKQLCSNMGMVRALTTAHHPQADGQTEVLNQHLEIALRSYINPQRDDWSNHLDALALSYNTTPHTATTFPPSYLLYGFLPMTRSTVIHSSDSVTRPHATDAIHDTANQMSAEFQTYRLQAQRALRLGQLQQERSYNKGRLQTEYKVGDFVVINPHSLDLLRKETGRGKKLLMKYDGPFEVLQRISPVTYRLRLPASYKIHPIINIAHLEAYTPSPEEFGTRPVKKMNRADFETLPEEEVEIIIGETWKKARNGRRIKLYRTRFIDGEDRWLTRNELRNAPEVLADWDMKNTTDSYQPRADNMSDSADIHRTNKESEPLVSSPLLPLDNGQPLAVHDDRVRQSERIRKPSRRARGEI
ncbi:hypothetical protein EUX98_g7699 [Antrodiella citrinella]|uniref:Reverse transcriptase n=1 Tax=Antrodiella citrinella TaxID=2447956 RepID=A0A4S4MSZ4_9APHY|nr:hypothetical protein EUX98_g7699 [Antrodiella citrinella]